MKDTEALLRELSSAPAVVRPLPVPSRMAAMLLLACLVCGVLAQCVFGFRPDLGTRLSDAWFLAETGSLVLLLLSSLLAAVHVMYPDSYQRKALIRLPYLAFALLALICAGQFGQSAAWQMQDATDMHGLVCSFSIAAVAVPPSALVMWLLGRGAVVHPMQAGSLAVLSGSALGCLSIRLHEMQDSMAHVVVWHYLPAVILAVVGALIGRRLLKW